MMLTVVQPGALSRLTEYSPWLFADDDPAEYARISALLGEDRRLVSAAAFQAEVARLRGPFLAWLDDVMRDCPAEEWIPASWFKDVHSTPVFLHFVCLSLVDRAVHSATPRLVVITQDAALTKQLQRHCASLGIGYSCLGKSSQLDLLRAWGRVLVQPWKLFARVVLANALLGKSYIKKLSGAQVAVDTFIFDNDIDANGRFHDRFLPGLVEWYVENGKNVVSMPFTANVPLRRLGELFRRMKLSRTLFAPGELFLRLRDFWAGWYSALRSAQCMPSFEFHLFSNMDVSLVARYWWRIAALNTLIYRIWYHVPARMFQSGVCPGLVLDWNENQPLDKAMTLGFYRISGCVPVAVRQYFPFANMINLFATTAEVAAGVSPRDNWVCGEYASRLFSTYDRLGDYRVVPALRYAQPVAAGTDQEEGKVLAIFLTSSLDESMQILAAVFKDVGGIRAHFDVVHIKPHQALRVDIDSMANQCFPAMKQLHVVWEEGNAAALLSQARLIVTAGSSVALEAVCRGIPVVIIGRMAGLLMNPLGDVDERLWRLAYNAEQFSRVLQEWFAMLLPFSKRQLLGKEICNTYFQPVTPETMLAFLPKELDNSDVLSGSLNQ